MYLLVPPALVAPPLRIVGVDRRRRGPHPPHLLGRQD
jgi:hypothetical protein